MARGPRGRDGFTFLELIVALAIMALLGAVLAPQVMNRIPAAQSASLLSNLVQLRDAAISHREDVIRYPRTLRQLSTPPSAGVRDVCHRPMASGVYDGWDGPYLNREVPATGIPTSAGTIADTLRRDPPDYSATGTVFIEVVDVDQDVATRMEASIDGDANFATGTIRWTQGSSVGVGTLRYAFPARGC